VVVGEREELKMDAKNLNLHGSGVIKIEKIV
jgi:hypothetical protein